MVCFFQNEGATGVEPATAGSAIPCSATELHAHVASHSSVPRLQRMTYVYVYRQNKPTGRIELPTSRLLSECSATKLNRPSDEVYRTSLSVALLAHVMYIDQKYAPCQT